MRLHYLHTEHLMQPHVHGTHNKDLAVLHETVSPDMIGLADIEGVENDLAKRDYGIHGMSDLEGNMAWAYGLGKAIFYQAGGVNERSIGIEQVSNIPSLIVAKKLTRDQAYKMWLHREKQLAATAKLLAAWHNSDPKNHPLVYSNGDHPGVTSHWDVSQHHSESQGHWDCQPHDKGGHYPMGFVIHSAIGFAKLGWKF